MALNHSNRSNLEQLALKGLRIRPALEANICAHCLLDFVPPNVARQSSKPVPVVSVVAAQPAVGNLRSKPRETGRRTAAD